MFGMSNMLYGIWLIVTSVLDSTEVRTILVIWNFFLIKLFICVISFNTLWDEESEIFLQIKLSIQNRSNIFMLTCFRNTPIWRLKLIISNKDFCSQIHSY